ncbi:hypothetical protein [Reyranella sp.]|uniref:hypothetical protein n=1 Tax=Reyranella sp. TaxID=1929291 RepID=UPI0011FC0F32|nr:hypothetical protein [Reyranella sp.]TAJ82890.1 MAG: hypothetical protein EPO50_24630 [Reyranella sp.]
MSRIVDLTEQLGDGYPAGPMSDMVYSAFRRRPVLKTGRWILEEPPGGFNADPFLQIGQPIALDGHLDDFGRRVAAFLSPDMQFTDRTRPRSVTATSGFGLISELERLQYEVYFARDRADVATVLSKKVAPFLTKRLGATHCCVVRPSLKLQQMRLSLAKAWWALSTFPKNDIARRVTVDRVLDPIMPLAHEMGNWLHVFLSSPPIQVTATFQCLGGYILFYREGPWTFPYAAAAGIFGRFNASVSLDTSEGGMRSGIWLKPGTPDRIYDYLRTVTKLIDRLAFFALNPMNFVEAGHLQSTQQIQFITALGLLFSDIQAGNEVPSNYSKVSFSLSALDKLANIIEAMTDRAIGEGHAFKALLSTTTANGLRWIARQYASADAVASQLLRAQARRLLQVHRAVRNQAGAHTTEAQRLGWLRSYRNLRHGTFLERGQFSDLFVTSKGLVPSHLSGVTMAMVLGLAMDPEKFLYLVAAQSATLKAGEAAERIRRASAATPR